MGIDNTRFETIKSILPEEQKGVGNIDQIEGSTRIAVVNVLEKYDLSNYWYANSFNKAEGEILGDVFRNIDVDPTQLCTLDIGSGIGRSSELAIEAIKKAHGDDVAEKFSKNIHGVDLLPRFVRETQKTLNPYGVPPSNIIEGDFLNLSEGFSKEKFHSAWVLMNTLFYCTTEQELTQALRSIEEILATNGLFLFDTVELNHQNGIPNSEIVSNFDDLKNFYTVIIRMYRENNMSSEDLSNSSLDMCRYPIYDNTTGAGFYEREVITMEYLQHTLDKLGSKLRLITPAPIKRSSNMSDRNDCLELGRKWIQDNEMEGWLRKEIAYRLQQKSTGEEFIKPFYSLVQGDRQKIESSFDLNNSELDSILQKIATSMVENYTKMYYILKKEA